MGERDRENAISPPHTHRRRVYKICSCNCTYINIRYKFILFNIYIIIYNLFIYLINYLFIYVHIIAYLCACIYLRPCVYTYISWIRSFQQHARILSAPMLARVALKMVVSPTWRPISQRSDSMVETSRTPSGHELSRAVIFWDRGSCWVIEED